MTEESKLSMKISNLSKRSIKDILILDVITSLVPTMDLKKDVRKMVSGKI